MYHLTNCEEMNPITIACCGAAKAGKTQIQAGLSKIAGPSEFTTKCYPDRFHQLEFPLDKVTARFQWLGGAVFYKERMFREVLQSASIVVFVISTIPMNDESFQEDMWHAYIAAAKELRKTWDDVPWLFVVNKIDRSVENPLIHLIPEKYREDIIPCCAKDGRGLDILWRRIGETIKSIV